MVATAEWGQTEMGEERVLEEEAENDDVGPAEDPDLEESS
jgi:hypothetical protein